MSLLSYYDFLLRSNPLRTKMATNLAICCTGDLICQFITRAQQSGDSKKKQNWDLVRTARFGAVGACVQTTMIHWFLTRVVPVLKFSKEQIANTQTRRIAKISLRLTVHLTTLLPVRIGAIFFALSSLQHLSIKKGFEGLQANYYDGLKAAYCYWPLVFVGLYTVVPRRYGNLYVDMFNLAWAVALSYFASRDIKAKDEPSESTSISDSPPMKNLVVDEANCLAPSRRSPSSKLQLQSSSLTYA